MMITIIKHAVVLRTVEKSAQLLNGVAKATAL